MQKICNKCKISKELEDYPKSARYKSGYHSQCKLCLNTKAKETRNRKIEQYRGKAKERYWKNPEKARLERKNAYNPDKKSIYDITYRKNNKKKIAESKKNWEKLHRNEPVHKLKRNLRRRVHHVLANGYKSKSTQELIGCTYLEFKQHIESKFLKDMSWDNYGDWHLDHIKPCCKFDLTKIEEQLECFNYKNQQPLWATDNLKKGKKWK